MVAIGADGNDSSKGHVRIFRYTGAGWKQLGKDIDGEASEDYSGWSVSLSADGTMVAIGAYENDSNKGHVRIFRYTGAGWKQLGKDIDGEASGDRSGYSVSLSADGTMVAIGAYGNDNDKGHVRIFRYTGAGWKQLGKDIDGEASEDYSGESVSLSADGTMVAISAIFNDNDKGHVRIFRYTGAGWKQLGKDIDGEASGDRSGGSVSLSADGTMVAIGAIYNDSDKGHVRIFRYTGAGWKQLGKDIDGEASGDESGVSVSLSADGTMVAIGAIYNDGFKGHVRIFRYM